MSYNRFYTEFEDEQGWQYTLYILPSNANINDPQFELDSTLTTFTLVELPDDFLMRDLKIETELGEIPAGLVTQVMNLTCNIASLQGSQAFDDLRECLLKGTVQEGNPYLPSQIINAIFSYPRFNTFILMVNDGVSTKPIFIGCQKFSAENELTVTKLDNVLEFKIECFDVTRFICESITGKLYLPYFLSLASNSNALDYGNSYSVARNTQYTTVKTGTAFYIPPDASYSQVSEDQAIDTFSFDVNTFDNLKTMMDAMLTQYMKSVTWNTGSQITLPILFDKAWTFYAPRLLQNDSVSNVVAKPSFISGIYRTKNGIQDLLGGAIYDDKAFGKFKNFYDIFKALIENSLEIYRLQYSWSLLNGWFSVAYTSDFIRPLTSSGITFNQSNIYSDVKMKFFQETIKSAKTSVSTLQGDKDNKVFPYAEGSSSDNGKDVELIFHNLPSPSGRVPTTEINEGLIWRRNAINPGMIVWNDSGTIRKVDSSCRFKYSNTNNVQLDYTKLQDDNVNVQQIIEQRESGIPYTIAYSLVKSLGDSKQVDLEFDSRHENVQYNHVGMNCTINLNNLNPLLTKIYNANTGTGVITKHSLDVYSANCQISVRMYS